MADYIEREEAIKAINDMYEYEFPTASGPLDEFFVKFVPATLRAIPAADVAPVVHGRRKNYSDCGCTRCSICDWSIEEYIEYPYCPNCGAKMDGGVDDEKSM